MGSPAPGHRADGTVILHGDIPDHQVEAQIVSAIEGIAGVHSVHSHPAAMS